MISAAPVYIALAALTPLASAHIAFWHKAMWGFNVTDKTYSYDNRPQTPLMNMPFSQWWFHGHLDHPPNAGDFVELPAGKSINAELSCDKGATSWYNSSEGGNAGYGSNWPCPGQPSSEFHTTGQDDLKGCALAIAYKSDVTQVQPEDFAVFSVNHQCVWTLNTPFQVPAAMPACPPDGCICAWFWVHSVDSGSEQNYMNGFRCKVTGATSTAPVQKPALARRCGADPANGIKVATPSNCTVGPKQPFYWYQTERNNMFEGQYSPPYYNDLYGFSDGAQNDIFQAPSIGGSTQAPPPAPSSSAAPASSSAAAPAQSSSAAPAPAPSSSPAPPPAPASSSAAPAVNPSSSAAAPPPAPSPDAPAAPPPSQAAPAPSSSAAPYQAPAPSHEAVAVTSAVASTLVAPSPSVSAEASSASSAAASHHTKQCSSHKHGKKARHMKKRHTDSEFF